MCYRYSGINSIFPNYSYGDSLFHSCYKYIFIFMFLLSVCSFMLLNDLNSKSHNLTTNKSCLLTEMYTTDI